jgi:hypothetical protein
MPLLQYFGWKLSIRRAFCRKLVVFGQRRQCAAFQGAAE